MVFNTPPPRQQNTATKKIHEIAISGDLFFFVIKIYFLLVYFGLSIVWYCIFAQNFSRRVAVVKKNTGVPYIGKKLMPAFVSIAPKPPQALPQQKSSRAHPPPLSDAEIIYDSSLSERKVTAVKEKSTLTNMR